MTHDHFSGLTKGSPAPAALEALQSRFALRVTSRLNEQADVLNADVVERLRFAREQALQRAKNVRMAETVAVVSRDRAGAAVLGRRGAGLWVKFAAALPALALAAGLFMIQRWQDSTQISTAAEVDAALLSDDLPPQAYSDAGFTEFLKAPNE